MSFLAAAGIGAAGSIASGLIGSNAAKSAANTQSQAANYAADQQMKMFNMSQANFQPYFNAGGAAAGSLQTLLGIGGGASDPLSSPVWQMLSGAATPDFNSIFGGKSAQDWLAATPGYQFTLDQGLKSTQSALSAQGLGGTDPKSGLASGSLTKGLSQYATGLASTTFQQQFQNYLQSTQQRFGNLTSGLGQTTGLLQNLAGLGQASAANVGALGVQSQTAANQLLTSGAAAQAGGQVGSANALTGAIGGLGSTAQQYALLSSLTSGGMFGKQTNNNAWGSDTGAGIQGSTVNPFT